MFEGNLRIRLRDFVRELRRRKVIRATIAYAIAGVGIAEGAAIFLPPLGAPAWVPNIIAVIVVLGFPVALVLAWAFDIVPDTDEKPGVHNEAEAGSAVSATREPRSATRMEGERRSPWPVQCLGNVAHKISNHVPVTAALDDYSYPIAAHHITSIDPAIAAGRV